MKKLLLSLAVAFTAFGAANAADLFTVTSNGNPVNDGDVIELSDYELEDFGADGCGYKWSPELFAKAVEGTVPISITVTANVEGFSICYPIQCVFVAPGFPTRANGDLTTTPSDLQVHYEIMVDPGETLQMEEDAVANIRIVAESQTMAFTVVCKKVDAAVDGIMADSAEIVGVYDLQGRKLSDTQNGLNIVRYSDGRVVKTMVRK